MKLRSFLTGLMIVSLGLVGCARRYCLRIDYITNAFEIVKTADWSKMETISIVLTEYVFLPERIVFHKDIHYKLEIRNEGTIKHYFTAEKFFKAIATRKVQSNIDGEIKAPYFTALEVFPGHSLDLYFIPIKKGTYDVNCTIKGHAEKGMSGRIIIE